MHSKSFHLKLRSYVHFALAAKKEKKKKEKGEDPDIAGVILILIYTGGSFIHR
jgi:helix-turn-helix protein